jgi:peptidoglycan/xylan/chitin deacetylase (PgdA/CDA1 family)
MSGRERRGVKRKPSLQRKSAPHVRKKNATGKKSYKVDRSRRKILYLTFDDGPLTGTENVLRVLREEGVDATMFFVGKHIRKRRALYNRAVSMSNLLIANHTYSHANGKYTSFYSSMTRVLNDINRAQTLIGGAKYLRLAGRNVWRIPHVSRNDYALSKSRRKIEIPKYEALVSRGYQIYGWDIEWQFNHTTGRPAYGAELMVSRIESKYNRRRMAISGKMILLAHDTMFRGASGISKLRELIRLLKYNGWEFATIDDYSSSTPAVFVKQKQKHRHSHPFDQFKVTTGLDTLPKKPKEVIHIAWTKKQNATDKRVLKIQ